MRHKNAFTLIELLVVIAVIAILLSILLPTLNKVKEIARMVQCLSNHRALSQGWKMYSNDYKGYLINGDTNVRGVSSGSTAVSPTNNEWVIAPYRIQSSGQRIYQFGSSSTPTVLEYELNGIRGGTMFPYVKNVDVYNCPSDQRGRKGNSGQLSSFRTYSMPVTLNGEKAYWGNSRPGSIGSVSVTREGQILDSSSKFVLVDDWDARSFNMGSWTFNLSVSNPNNHRFGDPISVWHFKKCNFGYADGHAAPYVWQDSRTHKFSRYRAGLEQSAPNAGTSGDNPDLRFLGNGYKMR